MVFVLEGTSVALALQAADRIQQALALPNAAFSYLRSHGTLDQQHTRHLADLLERMTPEDQAECDPQRAHLLQTLRRHLPGPADARKPPCN
jgi:hypothetical protein